MKDATTPGPDFLRAIVTADVEARRDGGRVATRFPPEPNGYLHIGHTKSIALNFGIAEEFGGTCNLRFDDTNPLAEDVEYVEAIEEDIRWLGYDWEDRLYFASDYFERLYGWALDLVSADKAYVCSLTADEIRAYRGTLTEPGRESPYRNRSVAENLDLFALMRAGEFDEGDHVLRAKIDMASPNLSLRDPTIYRIRKARHHRTGDAWCIYPMYDFAHCLSDAIEGITHSICTLEFENNRALYDWFLDNLDVPGRPRQTEFARLNLTHTVMSKRILKRLVAERRVSGWDDPRMPTVRGLRRRGYTPAAIRTFSRRVGVARRDGVVGVELLEHCLREDLEPKAPRRMGVLRPLKVTIENYPEGQEEFFEFPEHPDVPAMGTRSVPFSRVVYVERDDFRREAPRQFHRLAPGKEVRLRFAYLITCKEAITGEDGEVVELVCTHDPASRGGNAPDGRKVRGTIHWVSAAHSIDAEVRLYGHLFTAEQPGGDDLEAMLNPDSIEVLAGCKVEPSLAGAAPGSCCQFERQGYFCVDPDATAERLVFNRAVALKDSWAKIERR